MAGGVTVGVGEMTSDFRLPPHSPPSTRKGANGIMTTKRAPRQPTSVHQLKVTLLGLEPAIWRRIAVPSDVTLTQLHDIVQAVMGWEWSHLHDFRVGKVTYADPDLLYETADQDERTTRLADVAPKPRKRLQYLYDFGDSWEHEIVVEAVGPPEAGVRYPICRAGERAGPPEDCGGVWGYADLLETLADPDDPDRDEMLEWLGGPIAPEVFRAEAANRRLKQARLR
jgi:hypothetical protein